MTVVTMKVVCTGKGTHGEIHFTTIEVDGDTITEVTTRRGRSPVSGEGTATVEGRDFPVRMRARMVVPATSARTANGNWRFPCRKCRRDRPMTDANFRKWVASNASTPAKPLDISKLPR